jgi:hypothetical protein
MGKEYFIDIAPGILELLGPSLYTNIYFVLAELIANAYDADAKNVYVICKRNTIIVEDDGKGMSYENDEIKKYLQVARNSRHTEEEAVTENGRRRMGRKGVGKLAALSVSESVRVKTVANGEKSGFILSRTVSDDKKLEAIPEDEITFERIGENGTSIEMTNPQYELSKSLSVIKRNLIKIFPLADKSFKIHIVRGRQEEVIDSIDGSIVPELATLITIGEDFKYMASDFRTPYEEKKAELCLSLEEKSIQLELTNNDNQKKIYDMRIRGWIGTYKTTSGQKASFADFPDNFISLYANKKMGEFNVLPYAGKNKMTEMYIAGQLHVDLFEMTELPDMALSNRQGYKTDDPRYLRTIEYIRNELLPQTYKMRDIYTDQKRAHKAQRKIIEQEKKEQELAKRVDALAGQATKKAVESIQNRMQVDNEVAMAINAGMSEGLKKVKSSLGLKVEVDDNKKRLMISHASADKDFADVIYAMLLFNGFEPKEILYTSCDDAEARLPETATARIGIYDYIKKFYVDSVSDKKMYIIFATSHNTESSWGAMTEIGAAWVITEPNDNMIFNIKDFVPKLPLDVASVWQETQRDASNNLFMTKFEAGKFVKKIQAISEYLGHEPKNEIDNRNYLNKLVSVV